MERSPNISWLFHFRVLCKYRLSRRLFFFFNSLHAAFLNFYSLHFSNGLLRLNMKYLEMKLNANHFCFLLSTAAQCCTINRP